MTAPELDRADTASFCTVSDAGYFLGTVGLLNSLRLTGHEGEVIVLDAGLLPDQRERIAPHCRVIDLDGATRPNDNALQLKPFVVGLELDGVAVVIDSDIIVTGPLTPFLRPAAAGSIAALPDPDQYFFPEWEQLLDLGSPPTRSTYICTACVALDAFRWRLLLSRWWELSVALDPSLTLWYGAARDSPLAEGDQSVLNALLMSEVDRSLVSIVQPEIAPLSPVSMRSCRIVDVDALACMNGETPTVLLHHGGVGPKPWAGPVVNPYARLLPRVLFGEDVVLRLDPRSAPAWLRPGLTGTAMRAAASGASGVVRRAKRLIGRGHGAPHPR